MITENNIKTTRLLGQLHNSLLGYLSNKDSELDLFKIRVNRILHSYKKTFASNVTSCFIVLC